MCMCVYIHIYICTNTLTNWGSGVPGASETGRERGAQPPLAAVAAPGSRGSDDASMRMLDELLSEWADVALRTLVDEATTTNIDGIVPGVGVDRVMAVLPMRYILHRSIARLDPAAQGSAFCGHELELMMMIRERSVHVYFVVQ